MSASGKEHFRILITRTDRLGDVLLATPVLRLLKEIHPTAKITFLVQKQWMPVLKYGDAVELMAYDPAESEPDLVKRLKEKNFNRAYVLRDEKKISWAVRKARIPERIGPYSNLRSFFLFNRGRFQKRSACKMHESEYNLDLVVPVTPAHHLAELPHSWVETDVLAKEAAQKFLRAQDLRPHEFVVIHPGSSGSARYVKQATLRSLATAILDQGLAVCISGGPGEESIIDGFFQTEPRVKILAKENSIGLDGMAEVYRQAKAVIAHGTGPLHLAAAVGTPTLAIFPPIFVLSEKRWGPLVNRRSVWVPPGVECPAIYKCIGEKCGYYDCMDRLTISEALSRLETITS